MTVRTTPRVASLRWLVAGVVVMAALARLPSYFHQLFDPDEAAVAAQAIALRNGGTLYVDAIDRKPPLPAFVYSWSFQVLHNTDLRPLHALMAVALAGAGAVLAFDARRRSGYLAGWWAAALLVGGAVAFSPVDAQAANYAHFALLPGAVTVVAARRGTTRCALIAGAALGLAVLCRQTWAIGVVPAMVAAWLNGSRRDAVAVVGAAVGTVAMAGLFVPIDGFWHWVFASNEGFVLGGVQLWPTVESFGLATALFVVLHLTLVAMVGVAAKRRLRQLADWRRDVDLWIWLATAAVAVVAGFRFYGHYWLQALPPAVALAAPAAARLAGRLRLRAVAALVVPTAVAVGLAFFPGTLRHLLDPAPLAAYVDAHSAADERILMWGNYPDIYWAADRAPAGAFVQSGFVTGLSGHRAAGRFTLATATPGARATFVQSLREHLPALILDTSTAGLRSYGSYPMTVIPQLAAIVARDYEKVTVIDGITIYQALHR